MEKSNSGSNNYDLNQPWLTLDNWQKEYIKTEGNTFLLCGRQAGKSAAASIKVGKLAVTKPKSTILMISYTEKQAFLLFSKCLNYLTAMHPNLIYAKGKYHPTQHKIMLKNGSLILCYAAGTHGLGLVGHTITDLFVDEAHLINRSVFIQLTPTLSVTKGTINLLGTAGECEGYFYECSDDLGLGAKIRDDFTRFYVSAEDCPRHTKEFLDNEKKTMSELEYAQQYLAQFTDKIRRLFPDELLDKCCVAKRSEDKEGKNYLGMDIAGLGEDLSTFEIVSKISSDKIVQRENITRSKKFTFEISGEAIELNKIWKFKKIGIDDGGVGFGVFSELFNEPSTKDKVVALNNASRPANAEKGTRRLLKEEMYITLRRLMEQDKIKLLNDSEVIYSLKTIQWENVIKEGQTTKKRIFGRETHITEGIIRAVYLAAQDKTLNLWAAG